MTREDLVRYATRDWSALRRVKTAAWIERKRTMSAVDLLRLGEELRRHAAALRPDRPIEADRAADLAHHERLSEKLRAVGCPRSR